ncbi:hypothetical protein ABLV49_23745 (plasmid) [Polaromonas hydrogenivorans]|uniref:Uncharacterized protein n=1 Tax=Polaromonas hydrogenivorans TaxID=335476 RepID=A0AAU7LZB5_9BURK
MRADGECVDGRAREVEVSDAYALGAINHQTDASVATGRAQPVEVGAETWLERGGRQSDHARAVAALQSLDDIIG